MVLDKEKLQKKYKKANDSLMTLKEALANMEIVQRIAQCAQQDQQKVYKTYRDSIIQRFEYTFDTTWKYLGDYLQNEGYSLPIKTPKAIFRESLKVKILSEDEARQAMVMVDHRNLTTHGYDEALIEEISKNIASYAQVLEAILQRSKKEEEHSSTRSE